MINQGHTKTENPLSDGCEHQAVEKGTAKPSERRQEAARIERLATLGQLTGMVCHELRNPLGTLKTSLYLIQTKTKDKELGIDRALARADSNIARCESIISQILDFVRINEISVENSRIDDWLGEVLAELEIPDGIKLNRQFRASDVRIDFDGDRLRRAVINVFDNACQAIEQAIQADDRSKEYSLTVETIADNDRYEMVFTDCGDGMDEETVKKMFEPLFSTKSNGTGLGMPIVQQIMEMHSGGIEIASTVGKGTSVVLWLPLARPQAQERIA